MGIDEVSLDLLEHQKQDDEPQRLPRIIHQHQQRTHGAADERPYNVAIILLYSENSYKRKRSALRTPFSYAHKIIKKEGNSCLIK